MTTDVNETDFVNSLLAAHGHKEETADLQETEEEPDQEEASTEEDVTANAEADPEDDGEEAEEEATEESEVELAPRTFRVKVDGEEIEVTEQDLIRSYSGSAYIQKGMQEAAAAKKDAQALMQSLQSGYSLVQQLTQQLQTEGYIQAPKPPAQELSVSDPVKYVREQAAYQTKMAQYQEQQAKLAQASTVAAQLEARQMEEALREQDRILTERIPEFADPQKRVEITSKLVKTGREVYGYSEEELSQVMDARAIQVLHDAARWRELQAGTAKASKPTRPPLTVKPSAKPSENPVAKKRKALEAVAKSDKTGDIVATLLKANSR